MLLLRTHRLRRSLRHHHFETCEQTSAALTAAGVTSTDHADDLGVCRLRDVGTCQTLVPASLLRGVARRRGRAGCP